MWDKNGATFNKTKGDGRGLLHFDDSNSYNNQKAELVHTSYEKLCMGEKDIYSANGCLPRYVLCYVGPPSV